MGLDTQNKDNSLPLGLTATMGPLVKYSLQQILPNTPGTDFSVTNPNTPTDSNSQTNQGFDWHSLQKDFNNGVNKAVDGAGKAWQTIQGLFGGQ